MKISEIQIDPTKFYKIGKYLFFVSGIIGIVKLLDMWNVYQAYDIVSSVAGLLFNFLLSGFFAHLQGKENVKELNDGDIFKMNEALEKLNLEGDNGKKK